MPNIISLLKQEHIELNDDGTKTISKSLKNKTLLSVILPEEYNKLSSPRRSTEILESISLFYEACATISELSPNELSVLAIGSGSHKSFDFLGAAKVIECVKELILSLWDRIIFYRERQLGERLDLIAKTLPIIEKINDMEKEGKLGPEQSEILRRNIVDGANKFISVGAIIPEIEKVSTFNPRALMTPEPKLLAEHAINTSTDALKKHGKLKQDDENNELTDEEEAYLESILKKKGKNKK